jgi:hypothetical protein
MRLAPNLDHSPQASLVATARPCRRAKPRLVPGISVPLRAARSSSMLSCRVLVAFTQPIRSWLRRRQIPPCPSSASPTRRYGDSSTLHPLVLCAIKQSKHHNKIHIQYSQSTCTRARTCTAASRLSTHSEPSPRSQTKGLHAANIISRFAPPLTCLGNFRRLIFPGSSAFQGLLPISLANFLLHRPQSVPLAACVNISTLLPVSLHHCKPLLPIPRTLGILQDAFGPMPPAIRLPYSTARDRNAMH